MRKNKIKLIAILITMAFLGSSFSIAIGETSKSSKNVGYFVDDPYQSGLSIGVSSNEDVTEINYKIKDYSLEPVNIEGNKYVRIVLDKESNILAEGFPDVPNICRSIIIPDNLKTSFEIIESKYHEIENIQIAPSKGIIPRSVNPEDVPYIFDHIYFEDGWYPENLVELETPYIMRDFRGQVVKINPFQYNPLTKKLRVYDDIKIKIFPDGKGEINVFERTNTKHRIDRDFYELYKRHFINFGDGLDGYNLVLDQGNMLIICYDSFYSAMLPFLQWKNMKGIPTEMVNLSDIGSTATDIDTYIDNYYFNYNLTFVLLVGDIAQIPSMDTPYSAHVSDPCYSYIVGDDRYQDIFIGRFSAQNESQVITQVERSVEYEKYSQPGADWYHKGTGIGSPEGVGDDNEYDWEHIRNLRNLLYTFTYTFIDEFYGGSQGGDDDPGEPSTAAVMNSLNEGRSILNYCGHGAWDGIGWSAMPGWYVLHNDDINALTNDNKLPYVVLVACDSGDFENYNSCCAETWLRATNNGEPTGAIGCFASTQSQSWDPPMEGQDEIVDLLVNSTYNTMGGLSYSGTMSMTDKYGSSCYDETDTWTLFGDPSLQIMTDTPDPMTVTHDDYLITGSSSFELNVDGVEGALCAISSNGVLLGYGYTDANGDATIDFDESIDDIETADLVITSFNKITYLTTLDVGAPLRNIAEFDSMEGVLIRYPFGISYDIIAEMSEDIEVVTIVANSGEQSYVESQYSSHGVNTDHTSFLIAPSESHWTRDYGPWFIYNYTSTKMEVVDFTYNRPRPNDNAIPFAFAQEYNLNYSLMPFEHTGGNYMTDGQGISASTDLVYSENPSLTADDIDDIVATYLGIREYHVYPDPLGEYIEHIDCWAKFLAPDKIMIIEVSPSHSNYYDIEAAVDYFQNQVSCYDTPYKIYRVYTHLEEPYINCLILNDKVLVPITGSPYDNDALTSYEAAMPGYEVLGFTGSWENTDALHCRAKGIADRNMIYISHTPIKFMIPSDNGFPVEAEIITYNTSLQITSAQLHWKNSSQVWNSVPMSSRDNNMYSAYVPPHPCGETIYYYISAGNNIGKIAKYPFIGAPDPFSFNVTLVPEIWIDPLSFHITTCRDVTITENLTVGNDVFAGEMLNFSASCTSTSGEEWLSISPSNGSLYPNNSTNITLTINTSGLDLGYYAEIITITSNDLDEPILTVPVNLTILLGNDIGPVSVNYPIGTLTRDNYIVNATITNFGIIGQTGVTVNCTIREGLFGVFLYEDFSGELVPPVGWSQEEAGEWDVHYGAYAGGESPEAYLYWNDINGDYACLDSATVDTIGAPVLSLSFAHHISHYTGTFNLRILARGSSSASWIDVTPWTNPISNDVLPEIVTTDITQCIGPETQVRFEFDGDNYNLNYWYLDDVKIFAAPSRDEGDIVYASETIMDISQLSNQYIEFLPAWNASELGIYGIIITTILPNDEDTGNDIDFGYVEIYEDVVPPLITNVSDYPDPQCVEGFVNISCSVTDETQVNSVFINIDGPAGFVPMNVSMNNLNDVYYYNANYSIVGSYNYSIWAKDSSDNSVTSLLYSFEIINESFVFTDVNLLTDWNLITVPCENNWKASTLAENITGSLLVSWFDAENQTYKSHIVGVPGYDFDIKDGYGIFVLVDQSSVFYMAGPEIFTANVPLLEGWNMIGWFHNYNTTASSLAENITGSQLVSWYDAENETFKSHIVGVPGYDFTITPGMGLFVYTDVASTWQGEG